MSSGGGPLVEMNLTMWLFSKNEQELNRSLSGTLSNFSGLGFEFKEDRFILDALWNACLPMNTSGEGIKQLSRFQTMNTVHAAQFLPIIGEWEGTGSNGVMAFVTRRGQPALFDLYESSTNYNATLFAESGAGKSFFTQQLISDYLAEGAKVWAIDTGRSYYKLNKALAGEFIEFKEDSGVCLNMFSNVDEIDEEMDLIKAMLAKMAAPEGGLDDFRMAVLEEAIKATWDRYTRNGSVTHVAEWCEEQDDSRIRDIGKQLGNFTRHGANGKWFEGTNNLDLSNDFVVLELEELKSKKVLQQVVLIQLLASITREMYLTSGRKKILVADEAWELLDDPVMAKAMEAAYRKARKYGGAIIVVTQSVSDLYNNPNGRAIYENSAWQLFMKQKPEAIDAAIDGKRFSLEPYAVRQLKTVHTLRGKYSEVMIRQSGSSWGIFRLVVDRFSQVMYSTTGDEREYVMEQISNGVDPVEVINSYIENNG
jgi:conjugal transfer ATP-binding protein TraC